MRINTRGRGIVQVWLRDSSPDAGAQLESLDLAGRSLRQLFDELDPARILERREMRLHVLLQLARKIGTFEGRSRFGTWLYTVPPVAAAHL